MRWIYTSKIPGLVGLGRIAETLTPLFNQILNAPGLYGHAYSCADTAVEKPQYGDRVRVLEPVPYGIASSGSFGV